MMKNLNTYIQDLQVVEDFTDKNPTLIQQRRALFDGKKPNPFTKVAERFAEVEVVECHIGSIIHDAGMKFLEGIHQEIEDAKEPWQKSYEADVEEAAKLEAENARVAKLVSA